jgi:uncharacterized protein (DUF362 family)
MSTRRGFIKQAAIGAAGLAFAGKLAKAGPAEAVFDRMPGSPLSGSGLIAGAGAAEKSRVILVRSKAVVDAAGKVESALLESMLEKAVTTFAGSSSAADAWRKFISPEDVVGLKINTLGNADIKGMDYTMHFGSIIGAVAGGVKKAGVADKNIVVWDRSEEEMKEAGLTIQGDPGSMRFIANKVSRRDAGEYAATAYPVGGLTSRVSRILDEVTTSMINICVPKTHGGAVFTNALKNHYGSIDNPGRMHANNCSNPGIAEVNAIPIIRKKQKLVVSDALLMVIEAGPRWDRRFIRPFGGILVGTDPVAVDAVALSLLDGLRKAEGMEPVAPRVLHIALAEQLGLGKSNLEDIDLVTLNV